MKSSGSGDVEQRPVAVLLASLAGGGAERVGLNLAEALCLAGYRVDLIVVRRAGALAHEVPPGVRVIDLYSRRARRAIRRLRRYLQAEAPAAVISIAFQANLLALVAALGLQRRPKLIVTVHSTMSRAFGGLSTLRRCTLLAATKILYRRADALVAVSEGAAEDLAESGITARRAATIHNPVIRSDFGQSLRERINHPWFADGGDPVIVTVGRLTKAKDHRLLLAAFQRLLHDRKARLIIVGGGELRAELEGEASRLGVAQDVAFAGHVANPIPYMREADLFVLSSAWEGFGNALVEAMAAGTPVIATDCPHGPREILQDGKWGRLVPAGDPEALASAMREVLRVGGPDARGRARDFTVEAAADRYLALLHAVGMSDTSPRAESTE